MKLTWLHVSDFHIRAGDSYERDLVLNALVDSVRRFREKNSITPDLIFATGDIAFSGKEEEYNQATLFFDNLLGAAELNRDRLFVIPGNHDANESHCKWFIRTLETEKDSVEYFNATDPKPHLYIKFSFFKKWYDEYFTNIRSLPINTTCWPFILQANQGFDIAVLTFNSAAFSFPDGGDHNKLVVGRRCLDAAIKES